MIYEIASLPVHKEHLETFKQAFAEVVPLLCRAKGYKGHVFGQRIEAPELFTLIVQWESLEDHTPRFVESDDHQTLMMALQNYFSEEPQVYHFEGVAFAAS